MVRNRLRRQLRTLLRRFDPQVTAGWDVLIVMRGAAAGVRQAELEAALVRLLRATGLMTE